MTLEHQAALYALAESLSSAQEGQLMRRILQGAQQALIVPRCAGGAPSRGRAAHWRGPARAHHDTHDAAQRRLRHARGDHLRRPDGEDPQNPHRVVLPLVAQPAPAHRPRPARGDHGGVRPLPLRG